MFDLLGPIRKLATVTAFIAFFLAANAALLYALSSCFADVQCIGTGHTASVIAAIRKWGGMILPGNFYVCIQFMFLGLMMRRAYDYSIKLMEVSAKAT